MKILSINTSNIQSDIAVLNDGALLTKKMSVNQKHSESVMFGVDEVLTKSNLKVSNLDAVAVVIGPGSFTGIRIGISIALGFKTAFESLNLISISAFEFLKEQFLKENKNITNNFVCVFNALSGKYFIQEFDKDANPVFEAKMVDGDDFVKSYETIVGLQEENMSFLTHKLILQPEVLANISKTKFEEKNFSSTLTPLYLRKSQAEDMLDKKQ